jgi:hypothetical protein
MGVPKNHKERFTKITCRKAFTKKSTKKTKAGFFSILFYRGYGRFSVRGGKKHDKTSEKI